GEVLLERIRTTFRTRHPRLADDDSLALRRNKVDASRIRVRILLRKNPILLFLRPKDSKSLFWPFPFLSKIGLQFELPVSGIDPNLSLGSEIVAEFDRLRVQDLILLVRRWTKDCVLIRFRRVSLAGMDVVAKLKRGVSRQLSLGSLSKSRFSLRRQASLDPRLGSASRFAFGRQSSLDPNRRSPVAGELGLPENLDATMRLLFMACQGDARGVEDLLKDGLDVNSIDLDGRTALHIAACEGHVDVVSLLLSWRANIDARDRWGSTVWRSPTLLSVSLEIYFLWNLSCVILEFSYSIRVQNPSTLHFHL
ncbi:hypothetical protein B296_00031948, partial [Ensete ventricosum]